MVELFFNCLSKRYNLVVLTTYKTEKLHIVNTKPVFTKNIQQKIS